MSKYLGDCLLILSEAALSVGSVPSCKNLTIGLIHDTDSEWLSGIKTWVDDSSVTLGCGRVYTVIVLGNLESVVEASLASASA